MIAAWGFGAGLLAGLVLGVTVGWTTNGVYRAHLDVKRTKAAIPGTRKHRWTRIKAAAAVVFWAVLIGWLAIVILLNADHPHAPAGPSPSTSGVPRR